MSRYNINYYAARSGRVIKEDGTYVNVADGLNEDGSQNARIIYGPDGQPLSESNPLPVQLTGSNVQRVFRPLIFGGDEIIEVTTEGRVESEYVSLSNYKTIDIIIVTEGSAGLELDVNTSFGIGGRRGMSTVYDWVEDDWMVSYFSSGGALSGSGHASITATRSEERRG